MTKFLFGVAIVAFTSFCGYFLAKKFRQRKLFFAQFWEFNERFLTEIAYYRRPLNEFVWKYVYKEEFEFLLQEFLNGLSQRSTLDREIVDLPAFSFLTKEEKRVVSDYFLMLGKGDSASQKSYFSSVKETLKKLQTDADTACKRYGDLYVKLGFLCGLLILILIV